MPYQTYQSTWNSPYLPQSTMPLGQSYNQQYPMAPQYPQQQSVKVDGPAEAMNRFLMRYPANMLTPGFVSDPLFDINGRQFHTLSIEHDGRRNLETFDFVKHVDEQVSIDGAQFVSRKEYDDFVAKVSAALGAINDGLHGPVQAGAAAATAPAAAAASDTSAAGANAGKQA